VILLSAQCRREAVEGDNYL